MLDKIVIQIALYFFLLAIDYYGILTIIAYNK